MAVHTGVLTVSTLRIVCLYNTMHNTQYIVDQSAYYGFCLIRLGLKGPRVPVLSTPPSRYQHCGRVRPLARVQLFFLFSSFFPKKGKAKKR